MLSPVIENMSKQTFPLRINLLPPACLYGLFRNCWEAKLLGHLCHGLPRHSRFFPLHISPCAGVPGLILPLDATNDLVDAVAFIVFRLLVESLCHD